MIQSLYTQAPVEAVLTPVGLEAINGRIIQVQEPDLVEVHQFLLVDDAKEVSGLGPRDCNLGDSGIVVPDEEPSHTYREVRKRACQLLKISASHILRISLQIQRDQRDFCMWSNKCQNTVR